MACSVGRGEFVGECGEFGHRDAEGLADAADGAPGGVVAAGLEVRDPGRVQVGVVGDLLLAEAALLAELADGFAEAGLGFGSRGHLPGDPHDSPHE